MVWTEYSVAGLSEHFVCIVLKAVFQFIDLNMLLAGSSVSSRDRLLLLDNLRLVWRAECKIIHHQNFLGTKIEKRKSFQLYEDCHRFMFLFLYICYYRTSFSDVFYVQSRTLLSFTLFARFRSYKTMSWNSIFLAFFFINMIIKVCCLSLFRLRSYEDKKRRYIWRWMHW